MEVWIVVKKYLANGFTKFEDVFSSEEKANEYIQNSDESGDYVEYSKIKATLK